MAERPLLAKSGSVNVFLVVADGVDSGVLLQVVLECRYVEKYLVLEHSCVHPFGEFFDLFLNVGKEGVQTPASNKHDCIHWFFGKVHEHSKAGLG